MTLKEMFQYYLDHQVEFVEKYNGSVIVLKDTDVIGVYGNEQEALFDAAEKFEIGTFLIQKVTPGDEDYTQTFHSRVAFGS